MSLKKNIIANYASQLYVTLIGIIMVPTYIKYMGAEAYGLVGFFAMMQAWFQLLDMGLTPTMARETARFNGGATDALSLRRLLRLLEAFFIAVALAGAGAVSLGADSIAAHWLKVEALPLREVELSIVLMGLIIALRWMGGLYRGAIAGFERLVWLSAFNGVIATARFVLVIPYLIYAGASPSSFFRYQLAVAVIELSVLVLQCYRLLPAKPLGPHGPWQWTPLRKVLGFSLSIAFTSAVWVLVTQIDKLVLSKLLSLSEYGFFTLAVLVASGVGVISGPISNALLPRLTRLSAQGDETAFLDLYRGATQFITFIAVPAALVLACFAEQVLWAWTGNAQLASQAAPVLALYALGNSALAIAAFPYYLQYARGDLKLHLIGNVLFVTFLVPVLVWATLRYGSLGAGYAWLGTNVLYLLAFVPIVHRRFFAGLHAQWLWRDVLPIVLLSAFTVLALKALVVWPQERAWVAFTLAVLGMCVLLVTCAASPRIRSALAANWPLRRATQEHG